jgi:hypothetical protein
MVIDHKAWSNGQKQQFLARLAHELTVRARSTYEPGTTKVLNPELLRAYNEVQHRVTGSLHDHLQGRAGMSLSEVLGLLKDFGARHGRSTDVEFAINRALRLAHEPKSMPSSSIFCQKALDFRGLMRRRLA